MDIISFDHSGLGHLEDGFSELEATVDYGWWRGNSVIRGALRMALHESVGWVSQVPEEWL